VSCGKSSFGADASTNRNYQAPDGGRSLGEDFDCATSMLGVGEQGERYALHGSHCDYPRCSINFDLTEKGGTRPGLQVRTSPRVFGSTWTDRKVSRCRSADGGSVKGSDAYEGMPRSVMSRILGWDSRKVAKSVSSL